MTASFCNGCKSFSFSFCDYMSFCNGSRRFIFCDCLSFFDRLSFRCPFLVAWVFSVRFQLHQVVWLLFIWAFVFDVRFWFNELLWLIFVWEIEFGVVDVNLSNKDEGSYFPVLSAILYRVIQSVYQRMYTKMNLIIY